jgi:hypothetical protein
MLRRYIMTIIPRTIIICADGVFLPQKAVPLAAAHSLRLLISNYVAATAAGQQLESFVSTTKVEATIRKCNNQYQGTTSTRHR